MLHPANACTLLPNHVLPQTRRLLPYSLAVSAVGATHHLGANLFVAHDCTIAVSQRKPDRPTDDAPNAIAVMQPGRV